MGFVVATGCLLSRLDEFWMNWVRSSASRAVTSDIYLASQALRGCNWNPYYIQRIRAPGRCDASLSDLLDGLLTLFLLKPYLWRA